MCLVAVLLLHFIFSLNWVHTISSVSFTDSMRYLSFHSSLKWSLTCLLLFQDGFLFCTKFVSKLHASLSSLALVSCRFSADDASVTTTPDASVELESYGSETEVVLWVVVLELLVLLDSSRLQKDANIRLQPIAIMASLYYTSSTSTST